MPEAYNSPITEEPQEMLNFFAVQGKYAKRYEEQCCAEKCRAFLDGSYRRGKVDTVEKVLKILDSMASEYPYAVDTISDAVKSLLEEEV